MFNGGLAIVTTATSPSSSYRTASWSGGMLTVLRRRRAGLVQERDQVPADRHHAAVSGGDRDRGLSPTPVLVHHIDLVSYLQDRPDRHRRDEADPSYPADTLATLCRWCSSELAVDISEIR